MQKVADRFVSASKDVIARLTLSDEECQVLACIGRSARLAEILDRCGLVEAKALDALVMLRAKGAVAAVKRKKRPQPVPSALAAEVVVVEVVDVPAQAAAPETVAAVEDVTRAQERRERLARHPYLARIKRQYRPTHS